MRPTFPIIIGVLMCLVTLSGCGLNMFAGNKSPLIVDDVESQLGTLSFSTDRRVVLVRLQESSASEAGRFCTHPLRDTDQKVTSALSAMLEQSAEKTGTNMQTEPAQLVGQDVRALLKPTHGLLLYREAIYNLCQSYLNHAIKEEAFQAHSMKILELSVKLIEQELALTQEKPCEPPMQTPAMAQP
ncbi:MAG: hypothetical protein OEY28_09350 [Nitrospira sp.]|nr:hypothetical protein [Nitrospira sp.]